MRLSVILAACMTLASCVPPSMLQGDASSSSVSSMSSEEMQSSSLSEHSSQSSASSESSDSLAPRSSSAMSEVGSLHRIHIRVGSGMFVPDALTFKAGESVQLLISGAKNVHGFAIPLLRINESAGTGETIMIDLPTDNAGVFEFISPLSPADYRGQIVIID